jgi:hypothetical protein
MENKIKIILRIVVFLTVLNYTSCLKNGDDTIIVESSAPIPDKETESDISDTPIQHIDESEVYEDVEQDDLQGQSGDLRFNLQWYCKVDLDLMIYTPCGDIIAYYQSTSNCNNSKGILDVDANVLAAEHLEYATNEPQENVVFTDPTLGVYNVIIKSYDINPQVVLPSETIDFTLTIVHNNKRINTKGKIDKNSEISFCDFTVE